MVSRVALRPACAIGTTGAIRTRGVPLLNGARAGLCSVAGIAGFGRRLRGPASTANAVSDAGCHRFRSAQAWPSTDSGEGDSEAGGTGLTPSGLGDGGDTSDGAGSKPQGVRVYRRTRKESQQIFKWGIGSSFRMQSQNRFMPVHKPHPMETTVRDDYYDTENPNIVWENLNEAWEVYWYENNKLNAKPFPVKKFGVERSKREAYAFYDELKDKERLHEKPKFESPQSGVFYDSRMQDWVCFFWRGGRPLARCFSATKYGYEGAKMLAIAKQNDPVNGVLPIKSGHK